MTQKDDDSFCLNMVTIEFNESKESTEAFGIKDDDVEYRKRLRLTKQDI